MATRYKIQLNDWYHNAKVLRCFQRISQSRQCNLSQTANRLSRNPQAQRVNLCKIIFRNCIYIIMLLHRVRLFIYQTVNAYGVFNSLLFIAFNI
jgi:hypothetical protein